MANGHRGPKSDDVADIYAWAIAHDVEVRAAWTRQWNDNTKCENDRREWTKAVKGRFTKLEERVRVMEDFKQNMQGRIATWAAIGAILGGGVGGALASFVLR